MLAEPIARALPEGRRARRSADQRLARPPARPRHARRSWPRSTSTALRVNAHPARVPGRRASIVLVDFKLEFGRHHGTTAARPTRSVPTPAGSGTRRTRREARQGSLPPRPRAASRRPTRRPPAASAGSPPDGRPGREAHWRASRSRRSAAFSIRRARRCSSRCTRSASPEVGDVRVGKYVELRLRDVDRDARPQRACGRCASSCSPTA